MRNVSYTQYLKTIIKTMIISSWYLSI